MTTASEDRRIVFVRHAEAASATASGEDRDRPLTDRGRDQARASGRWLHEAGIGCDLVLCSPSARTRETIDEMALGGCSEAEVDIDPRLYNATPEDVLSVLREVPHETSVVLVVAHAPGAPAAVSLLADGEGSHAAHEALADGFPVATVAILGYAGRWSDLAFGRAMLEECFTPR